MHVKVGVFEMTLEISVFSVPSAFNRGRVKERSVQPKRRPLRHVLHCARTPAPVLQLLPPYEGEDETLVRGVIRTGCPSVLVSSFTPAENVLHSDEFALHAEGLPR